MIRIIITLRNHYCYWVWWRKNFENRSTFAEVMGKNQSKCFFWLQCRNHTNKTTRDI